MVRTPPFPPIICCPIHPKLLFFYVALLQYGERGKEIMAKSRGESEEMKEKRYDVQGRGRGVGEKLGRVGADRGNSWGKMDVLRDFLNSFCIS